MAPAAPALHHLPEPALHSIFDHLSLPSPRTAGTHTPPSARALASTARRLDAFFRRTYVTTLRLTRYVAPWILARALARHPAAAHLSVRLGRAPVFLHIRAALTTPPCTPPRAAALAAVTLESLTLNADGVLDVARHCTALRSLVLDDCAPLSDALLDAATALLARSGALEHLAVNASGRPDITDRSGCTLSRLASLTSLDLSHCGGVSSGTFAAIGTLAALTALRLVNTRITDADVEAAVSPLRALATLDVSSCESLTPAALAALPPSIRHLTVHQADVLSSATAPRAIAAALPNLQSLVASESVDLTSWAPLLHLPPSVTTLNLSGSSLTDALVGAALGAAAALRSLDVGDMQELTDETARAAAACPRLESLCMNNTGVTNDGIAAVAAGRASRTLRHVNFSYCERVRDFAAAQQCLLRGLRSDGVEVLLEHDELDTSGGDDGDV